MGFNIHILSGRRPSQNLDMRAALAASFNPAPIRPKRRTLQTPVAAARVREILGENTSLASLASWADDYRALHLGTARWRLVDIQPAAQDHNEAGLRSVAGRRLRHSRACRQPARVDRLRFVNRAETRGAQVRRSLRRRRQPAVLDAFLLGCSRTLVLRKPALRPISNTDPNKLIGVCRISFKYRKISFKSDFSTLKEVHLALITP